MFHFIGDLLCPAGSRGKLTILSYHRTLTTPDSILHDAIDLAGFERHMTFLAEEFNVLPLSEACELLSRGKLPARAVAITFDDGYADNEKVALPILKRLRLPAAFFIATGFMDGTVMFNDVVIETVRNAKAGVYDLSPFGCGTHNLLDDKTRRQAADAIIAEVKYLPTFERQAKVEGLASTLGCPLPRNLMMAPHQLKKLRCEGMEIGSHTVNHPILKSVSEEVARAEIETSKHVLEEITGAPVTLFAYPNGKPGRDYGPEHVQLIKKAGFTAAVSTVGGVAHRRSDVFQLPRVSPWDRNPLRLGARLLLGCARQAAA